MSGPRVVALGGGHGLHATLSALRILTDEVTAVVTVADDGGSSGRLRQEFGVLPPGDLRMALAALCGDDEWGRTWSSVLQHRFAGEGGMRGHAVGNLLYVGLWELLGDPVDALEWVGRLLGSRGRVLPMAREALDIVAQVRGLDETDPSAVQEVRGQVEVATTRGRILSVAIDPETPAPCPEAIAAVREADWVVLGPGSWWTSVLPHLMVPELRDAITHTAARRLVVLNLAEQRGETSGYGPADHLGALRDVAPDLRLDVVLADRSTVSVPDGLREAVAAAGGRLELADVTEPGGAPRHDPGRLADALIHVLTRGGLGDRGRGDGD